MEKAVEKVSTLKFLEVFSKLRGGTMVNLTSITPIDARAIGLGWVKKYCKQSIQIGCNYENAVNIRLKEQGLMPTFKASSLPFGQWIVPNRVLEYQGRVYCRFYKTRNCNADYKYIINGRLATAEETALIDAKCTEEDMTEIFRQSAYGLRGERFVKVRNYRIDHIIGMSAEGKRYELETRFKPSLAR